SGQSISTTCPKIRVRQPGEPMPRIEPPSEADCRPQRVSSRNDPSFATEGFWYMRYLTPTGWDGTTGDANPVSAGTVPLAVIKGRSCVPCPKYLARKVLGNLPGVSTLATRPSQRLVRRRAPPQHCCSHATPLPEDESSVHRG